MGEASFSPIPREAGAGRHGHHTRAELTQDLPVSCLSGQLAPSAQTAPLGSSQDQGDAHWTSCFPSRVLPLVLILKRRGKRHLVGHRGDSDQPPLWTGLTPACPSRSLCQARETGRSQEWFMDKWFPGRKWCGLVRPQLGGVPGSSQGRSPGLCRLSWSPAAAAPPAPCGLPASVPLCRRRVSLSPGLRFPLGVRYLFFWLYNRFLWKRRGRRPGYHTTARTGPARNRGSDHGAWQAHWVLTPDHPCDGGSCSRDLGEPARLYQGALT